MYKVMINSKKVLGDKDSKDLDCVCSFTTLDAAELYVSKYPRLGLIVEDGTKEYDDFVENAKYDNSDINYDDLIDNDDSINPEIPNVIPFGKINFVIFMNGLLIKFDKIGISSLILGKRDIANFDNRKYFISFDRIYHDYIFFDIKEKRCL